MPIFRQKGEHLELIKEAPYKLEKDIQNITENNLDTVFGLQFVRSEFELIDFRVDTLAFDISNDAFVIIEYKRSKNFSVIDQGYAYLSLMLNNKADCILEYNESKGENLKRSSVDWSQSRVIFVAPSFTKYQRESINFRDLPIELWEIKRFSNGFISFNRIQSGKSTESISTISSTDTPIQEVSKEIKVYSEQEHLDGKPIDIVELYEQTRDRLLDFGDVDLKPTLKWVAFKAAKNFADICVQKSQLKIYLNMSKGDLDDPKGLSRDVSSIGHWGNGDYELVIKNDEYLEYKLDLIKQSYSYNQEK